MGNCMSCIRREDQPIIGSQLQQLPSKDTDDRQSSDHSTNDGDKSLDTREKDMHRTAKTEILQDLERQPESVTEKLKIEKQSLVSLQEEKRTLSAKVEELERDVESAKNKLETERSLKEREIAELKKRLASITQEEKQKSSQSSVQKEQSTEGSTQDFITMPLKHFSSIDQASGKAHFRGFFYLHTPVLINGQPAQVGSNEQGYLTFRCPSTSATVTFNDLHAQVSAAVEKFSGIGISLYWCDDSPVFQLNVSSANSLKKLLRSKSRLQKQLSTKLSQMFKDETQVHLQAEVFLVLPSTSNSVAPVQHVTLDNAEECMAQWMRYAVFTYQPVFQQCSNHSLRNEPTLRLDNLKELVSELNEVTAQWFSLGIQLEVPYNELEVIYHNHTKDAKRCMIELIRYWLISTPDVKWSTLVYALAKSGNKHTAHKIARDHGVTTEGVDDVDTASDVVEENLMENPSPVQKKLMNSVDELQRKVKSLRSELNKQQLVLDEAECDRDIIRQRLTSVKMRMNSLHRRIDELMEEKWELQKTLKFREADTEKIVEKAYLVALKEEEVTECKKKLESVEQKLEEERLKIPPLNEKIQQLLVELAEKSEENRNLRNAWAETNSQLMWEREKVEMKTKELAAAAVSHAVYMKEVEIQLESLLKSKKRKKEVIHNLQENVKQMEAEIKELSKEIEAKQGQGNQHIQKRDGEETQMKEHSFVELANMKLTLIQLQDEVHQLRTEEKLAHYYQNTTDLYITTCMTPKFGLKWSCQGSAPKAMYRGSAVVHGTITYIVGRGSSTVYSYQLRWDKWQEHSQCPYKSPGLVIVNDLLTVVGGKDGGHLTNKLCSWNGTKWVETFPCMTAPRVNPAVVHYGNYIIVIGGDREERGIELLHIPSLIWSTIISCSLPRRLRDITVTVCNDYIIAMDYLGQANMINIKSLISSIQMEESSIEHSQWIPLPNCPVNHSRGPTLTTLGGQTVVVCYDVVFQLLQRQWKKIGYMPAPMEYSIVCVVDDQVVVVGGNDGHIHHCTDAVHVATIV